MPEAALERATAWWHRLPADRVEQAGEQRAVLHVGSVDAQACAQ
jgi:hypothetical protein